jgi:hypothetical protein
MAPHDPMLVLDRQTPLQRCVPEVQVPLHGLVAGMHAPRHSWLPPGQAGTHAVPSQLTVPPVGPWQGVHDVVPQLATAVLSTHWPPQGWKPLLQLSAHDPFWQIAAPWGSPAQTLHVEPQAVASAFDGQALPQRW